MPCGHSNICFLCAFALANTALKVQPLRQEEEEQAEKQAMCPLCRVPILRIYHLELTEPVKPKLGNKPLIPNSIQRVLAVLDFDPELLTMLNNLDSSARSPLRQPLYCIYH
jgi:hypothetical protein